MTIKAAIFGASGYAGAELLRLLAAHPHIRPAALFAHADAGRPVGEAHPHLPGYEGISFQAYGGEAVDADLALLALPHGESQRLVPALTEAGLRIIDLGADHRFRDPDLYAQWYGAPHDAPERLADFVYGLPELASADFSTSPCVAAPGCYPTAALLALTPLIRAGLIDASRVVVNAASGVSGAGKAPFASAHFCAVDGGMAPYGLLTHRHTGEMESQCGGRILFTPHLAPMSRGILATCTAPAARGMAGDAPLDALAAAYAGAPFIHVSPRPPSTKWTLGSNAAHLTARYDARTGTVLAVCALDNLVKGAAGQMIQCANLMFGLDETAGLPLSGLAP